MSKAKIRQPKQAAQPGNDRVAREGTGGVAAAALALALTGAGGLALGTGCQKHPAPASVAPVPEAPRSSAPADPGRELPPAPRSGATVSGKALLLGKPPAPLPQPHGSDPYCAKKDLPDDSLVVDGHGGIRSVLVRVAEAAGGPYAPPREPVIVTQLDCRYRPRVLGAVRGQPVVVRNSDGTLHNVHALFGDATLLNQVQVDAEAPPIDLQQALRQVDTRAAAPSPAGAPLRLRCDVHPWMSAYLFVLDHPFFAVTAEDGSFTLRNLPPGEYTLQAWHERLGTQSARIQIPGGPSDASASPPKVEFRFTMEKAAPG